MNQYIHLVHLEAKVSFGTFKGQAGGQDLRGPLCISIGIFSTIPFNSIIPPHASVRNCYN